MKIIGKEGPRALYKGATPPAVSWAAVDSILLGSLYNYRLFLRNMDILNEPVPNEPGARRVSILGHGLAGLLAGWTRSVNKPFQNMCVNFRIARLSLLLWSSSRVSDLLEASNMPLARLIHATSQSNYRCKPRSQRPIVSSAAL